jgi:DNA-binding transcriptional ArsR family regulator
MIVVPITSDDLVKMRFAYRPILEIPNSYRILKNPLFQSPYLKWIEEARRALYNVDLPYLDALIVPFGYIPDFLTPTPVTSGRNIEDDFAEVMETPDDIVRSNVAYLIKKYGNSETRQYFLTHPREALHCLVQDLRLYWKYALSHLWVRIISTLESDILLRGRLLAIEGPEKLFPDLHSTITFEAGQLQIVNPPPIPEPNTVYEFTLNGTGLQLAPAFFGCGRSWQFDTIWQPMLCYTVRGIGICRDLPASTRSLELALGTARAEVLQAVIIPASTQELAHKLQITAGAVSQHLTRLRRAGLVEPHRVGKHVFYQLTRRGAELVMLFDRTL